jgi:hypothetical protein
MIFFIFFFKKKIISIIPFELNAIIPKKEKKEKIKE